MPCGGVIVEHQVDVEIGWHGLFDGRQEPAEFDRAVPLVTTANDPAGEDVEGGEQRGRAMALVVMGAIEGLDLRLFIDAQDQRMAGGLR